MIADSVAAQLDRWVLWSPVFVGLGAAAYLALPYEPVLWPAALVVISLIVVSVLLRGRTGVRGYGVVLALATFAAAGFLAGQVRTRLVDAPVAPATGAVPVAGWVIDVTDPSETGSRIILAPVRLGDLSPTELPRLIRVTAEGFPYGPGAPVRFTGLVNPPPGPASPGGYDFARNAWFDRIGGSAVALTDPVMIDLPPPGPWLEFQIRLNALRWALAQKIAAKMSPEARGLGVAMVTGHEAWIDLETEENLRDSGLAHIVSISGLHMAIVGGFAFFLMRGAIALWPWLALRVPGKKVAAVFGLVAVGAYLLISGAPAPAIRAAVTASVAFIAILADRKAITLRALAIAALIVIFLQPEAVAEPGFQMSFAATAALVALAEAWTGRAREINTPWPIRLIQGVSFWLAVALLASLVAGLATTPFGIQHFNRVAMFSLPSNLAVQPLSSFVMMPSLALGAVLEPFGLGGPFLAVASWSIETMQNGAAFVSDQPGAVQLVASAPAIALPVSFLGILILCLWKGRGRWIGLPLAFAVLLWPRPEAPLAWIDNDGAQAAIRTDRVAVLARPEVRLFGAEYWTRRYALTVSETGARPLECSGSGCRSTASDYPRLSIWWTARRPSASALDAYCRSSDILAMRADVPLPPSCNEVTVLRRGDFERDGAVEIYPGGRLVWSQPRRGRRPWSAPAQAAAD